MQFIMKVNRLRKLIRSKEGISPVIATIIMVAVTVGIAVAVGGWLMGMWGGFTKQETLKVMADSYYVADGQNATYTFALHVQNGGNVNAAINKVIIGQNSFIMTAANATISANGMVWLRHDALHTSFTGGSSPFVSGASYEVRIYTQAGNVFIGSVTE